MTAKRIFILDGHPGEASLSRTFAETYGAAAKASGHEVRIAHLSDLDFDMDFGGGGYAHSKPLEPALARLLDDLEWSEHVVMTAPMWWGGLPAKLKGLIDRILLPGRAFDTRNPNAIGLPAPMLSGRTARVVLTSDTPGWFMRLAYGNALIRQLKGQIFGFVGFKPTRVTWFSGASHPNPKQVEGWAAKIQKIGAAAV